MLKNETFASPEAEQRRFVVLEYTVVLISLHPLTELVKYSLIKHE